MPRQGTPAGKEQAATHIYIVTRPTRAISSAMLNATDSGHSWKATAFRPGHTRARDEVRSRHPMES